MAALQEAGLARPGPDSAETSLSGAPGELAAAAETLRDAGLLKGWRDEALDVLADDDTVLGSIERAAMRPLGLRTRAVHLQALGPHDRLWIARRAAHKTTDPGMWDTLVGGLVGAGESLEHALLRESNEEAGLEPGDLCQMQRIGHFEVRRQVPEGYQVESTWITACRLADDCRPRNRDGEVDRIELATFGEVLAAIGRGEFTAEAALSILHWHFDREGLAPTLQGGAGGLGQG